MAKYTASSIYVFMLKLIDYKCSQLSYWLYRQQHQLRAAVYEDSTWVLVAYYNKMKNVFIFSSFACLPFLVTMVESIQYDQ